MQFLKNLFRNKIKNAPSSEHTADRFTKNDISNAIESLGLTPSESGNIDGFCVQSLRGIAISLIESIGSTPENASNELVLAICMLTSSGSLVLAKNLGGDASLIRDMAPINVFHKWGDGNLLGSLALEAESLLTSEANRKTKIALVGSFAKWIQSPTHENFEKLCKLVTLVVSGFENS